MILYSFLAMMGVGTLVALVNWRHGLFWLVLIGMLQDPARKLVPGVPGYLALATAPLLVTAVVGMLMTRAVSDQLAIAYPRVGDAARLFLLSLVPAALISATYGPGSWQLTILGAFTWGSILTSVLLGYGFARRVVDLRHFLGFYCVLAGIMLTGGLLEYLEVPFPALGTEMLGYEWVRHIPGVVVHMIAGFFRSPDVMGWHAVTVAMLGLTLALSGRGPARAFWITLAVWGASVAFLCGRRKMVYMLPFFVVAVTLLLWQLRGRLRTVPLVTLVLVTLCGVAAVYQGVEPDEAFMTYYTNDPSGVVAQVEEHGLLSLVETVRQSGFFGEGLGSASTGSQHLDVTRPRIWQESGPSRVLVELGVPGFVCFGFLATTILTSLWQLFRQQRLASSPHFALWVGLLAMILSNAGSFVVSGQIFGDPFITCLLAIFIGAVLGAARLEKARIAGRGPLPAATRKTQAPGYPAPMAQG